MTTTTRILTKDDAHFLRNLAKDVFDHSLHEARAKELLEDARHHLVAAFDGDTVVGFISAVQYVLSCGLTKSVWRKHTSNAASAKRCCKQSWR
jgi:hypothetical protein